jgi:hypothetical protein
MNVSCCASRPPVVGIAVSFSWDSVRGLHLHCCAEDHTAAREPEATTVPAFNLPTFLCQECFLCYSPGDQTRHEQSSLSTTTASYFHWSFSFQVQTPSDAAAPKVE